ncbi:Peptidase S54, rhomboid domain protein [Kalmanozyma brasiliensis GHG001]|uniref:Rhomboid-type serine protease n=1 Tax=Kalmanozyma brasiliensis (strain GHG001) TaxID=1365824 RepID=V5ER64_KALBG|nr:Peptidase S54, rhomboid domain protein [Kalmanozyma brasiliensis GHG001]EST07605.1 Peptidase S54, rhomboid domain protein [Kalmanozyma brasiliensis GHG001]
MSRYPGENAAQHSYHSSAWDPSPYGNTEHDRVEYMISPAGASNLHPASNDTTTDAHRAVLPASHMGVDSPSMYTDPFEAFSTAPPPHPTVTAAARHSYLQHDPYYSEDRALAGPSILDRADTLAPHDSISCVGISKNTDPDHAPAYSDAGADRNSRAHYLQQKSAPYSSHYDDPSPYYNEHSMDRGYDHARYDTSTTALPLKHHAGPMGYAEDEHDEAQQLKRGDEALWSNQMDQSYPPAGDEEAKGGLFAKFSRSSNRHLSDEDKLRDQIERRRQGIGRQNWPYVTYIVAVALVIVFVIELVKAASETGQAVQTRPSISPMLGPSAEFLISFGARFVPCMRNVPALPTSEQLPCLRDSTSASNLFTPSQLCPISQICGLKDASNPNQSYRFVSAIFVHAGFVHIFFNLLVQLTLCAQIEKLIGSVAYTIVYFAGGIGGNLLGGNFGLIGQPALGASGAIYTCISIELVDLCYNWRYEYRAKMRLATSVVFAIVGLALGLLPGLDNFAHIGGFCVGLLGGLVFAPAIHATKRHRVITWVLRIVALGLAVGFFAGLASNFYNSPDPTKACTWCRYLSCLPVFSSCKGNGLTVSSGGSTT